MDTQEALEILARDPATTGIFTDFDGTLSEIVDHPQDSVPLPGAVELLSTLARRFAVVAVVSGRSLDDLSSRLDVEGVILAGSYGRDRSDVPASPAIRGDWDAIGARAASAITDLEGVVLERKGAGVALHFRAAPERGAETKLIAERLASEFALELRPGRLVYELVEPGPGKADAIAALAIGHGLGALLIAGDDTADLDAFVWARSVPITSVLVAVQSEEAPLELASTADLAVMSPHELVALLGQLAELT